MLLFSLLAWSMATVLWVSSSGIDCVDTDTWWHLAQGRAIASHGLSAHDPLSATSDVAWLPYSWLWDVATFSVMRLLGYAGLVLVRPLCVLACFAILTRLCYSLGSPTSNRLERAIVASTVSTFLLGGFCRIRPYLGGYVCFALFLAALWRLRQQRGRFLLTLVLLTAATVNVHPTFALFPILCGAWWMGEQLGHRFAKTETSGINTLLGAGACAIASLANPFGTRAALHPFFFWKPTLYSRTIAEEQWAITDLTGAFHAILLALFALAALATLWRRRQAGPLFVWLALATVTTLNPRYVPYLALFLAPCVCAGTTGRNPQRPASLWAAAIAALALNCVQWFALLSYRWPPTQPIDWGQFPTDVLQVLAQAHVSEPVFNAYEWGGLLEWYDPSCQTFIDGRNEAAFSEEVYRQYLKVVLGRADWESVLGRHGVRLCLLSKAITPESCSRVLNASPRWRKTYEDQVALVYQALPLAADNLQGRLPAWPSPEFLVYRGGQALARGDLQSAEAALLTCLQTYPNNAAALAVWGVLQARKNNRQGAEAAWKRALEIDPTRSDAKANLAHLRGEPSP